MQRSTWIHFDQHISGRVGSFDNTQGIRSSFLSEKAAPIDCTSLRVCAPLKPRVNTYVESVNEGTYREKTRLRESRNVVLPPECSLLITLTGSALIALRVAHATPK